MDPWLFFAALALSCRGLVMVSLLIAVLFISDDINGARRWIDLGPIHMQPSEIAKIALAVFLAATRSSAARTRS